jgi:PQQ-dependent dehydrogenase (s-GDH family)
MHVLWSAVVVATVVAGTAGVLAGQGHITIRSTEPFAMRVVTTGLAGPWEVTFGPDQHLWVTERAGKRVVRINPTDGTRTILLTIPEVYQAVSQDGLLGLALHPDLGRVAGSDWVYVAFTYAPAGSAAPRLTVRRYRYDATAAALVDPAPILTDLPANNDHLGGRMVVGPDRKLYLSIGDQGANWMANRCRPNRSLDLPTAADVAAKNWAAYEGKILRMDLDGAVPSDNPTIDGVRSHVYSWGHRNPLGLVFGPAGLYNSEHGPEVDDEVNLIEPGRNYGWPRVAGFRDDKVYAYANWSSSQPTPCAALPPGGVPPSSVVRQLESEFTDPAFTEPLRTFFTAEAPPDGQLGRTTIAPGGLDIVRRDGGVPGWNDSLLVLSMVRGIVYRLPLAADGRSAAGPPVETFRTLNRYRDIAVHPNQRVFYLATDPSGTVRDEAGRLTSALANPGSILEFTYTGSGN